MVARCYSQNPSARLFDAMWRSIPGSATASSAMPSPHIGENLWKKCQCWGTFFLEHYQIYQIQNRLHPWLKLTTPVPSKQVLCPTALFTYRFFQMAELDCLWLETLLWKCCGQFNQTVSFHKPPTDTEAPSIPDMQHDAASLFSTHPGHQKLPWIASHQVT